MYECRYILHYCHFLHSLLHIVACLYICIYGLHIIYDYTCICICSYSAEVPGRPWGLPQHRPNDKVVFQLQRFVVSRTVHMLGTIWTLKYFLYIREHEFHTQLQRCTSFVKFAEFYEVQSVFFLILSSRYHFWCPNYLNFRISKVHSFKNSIDCCESNL